LPSYRITYNGLPNPMQSLIAGGGEGVRGWREGATVGDDRGGDEL